MGLFRLVKKLFGSRSVVEVRTESLDPLSEPLERMVEPEPEIPRAVEPAPVPKSEPQPDSTGEGWRGRLILSSSDLMQMARKLQTRGEYYRAEQLLRDGVKDARYNLEYWWLLYEIEDPLNRKGRAYYCIEQILQLDEANERALAVVEELYKMIDTDLSYFIEYKLAPEFYRLK